MFEVKKKLRKECNGFLEILCFDYGFLLSKLNDVKTRSSNFPLEIISLIIIKKNFCQSFIKFEGEIEVLKTFNHKLILKVTAKKTLSPVFIIKQYIFCS